jgi:Galactosyltransferase
MICVLPTLFVQMICNFYFLSSSATWCKRMTVGVQQDQAVSDVTPNVTTDHHAPGSQFIVNSTDLSVIGETMFLVSRKKNLTARFPSQSFLRLSQATIPLLVAGVLSGAQNVRQRQAIRETWAFGHHNVFFLVAGPWAPIADEFVQHRDLVWFDHADEYYKITWSVMGFIHLAHTKIGRFRHLFKTDDDSYIKLEDIEHLSATRNVHTDYSGACLRGNVQGSFYQDGSYPDYAAGFGYQISSSFAACIAESMARIPSINVEDANTGVFAHYCHVPCVTVKDYYAHKPEGWVTPQTFLVQHRTRTPEDMVLTHRIACTTSNVSNASCLRWAKEVDNNSTVGGSPPDS